MKQKFLTFGFKDEYMHMFGINNIGSIFHINKREQFAVTPKEIIKYERNQIIKRYHFHFSIGCCIDKYNMAAFITQNKSKLYIFSLKDMSRPLVSNFSLNQTGIFHILYSPRSNCLITFGTGVRVWQLSIEYPNQSSIIDPEIQITQRSDFAYDKYETMILNQPSFDYQKELIFLPTSQGIKGFNLDGLPSVTMTRLPAKSTTPIGYCQTNGKLLTSDPQEGVCLWDKDGKIKNTYTICSSSIISIIFINTEHAIIMNCHGAIFILNLKTGRSYHVYTSPIIPNRLFLQQNTSEIDPILVFIFNARCVYKRIVIPWTLWAKNVIYPKLIRRVNKIDEAGRILVQTNNSFVKLFSPKTAKPLTSASPQNSATTVYVMYDRGTFISDDTDTKVTPIETGKRDELFISMDDGQIYGFDTGYLPCQEVFKIDLKSTLITTCFYTKSDDDRRVWMYALASPDGEVFLCDYNSFRSLFKIVIGKYKPLNLFFHQKTESLVILFADEVVLLSVKKRSVTARIDLNCRKITASHINGNKLYIGLETGQIMVVVIVDHLSFQILNDLCSNVIHSDAVSSFAFARSFWVSAGCDGTVLFWEYSLNSIAKINLPEPIYACEVINGRRDLVVGTKSELMLIKGEIVFDGQIDDEIECIDNFDRKNDRLYSEIFTIAEEEEEIVESLLDQRKANNKNKCKNKKNVMQYDDRQLKKEEALNQMNKLINDKKIIKNDTILENAIVEEEEINDHDDDDESLKENKLKKKKVKKSMIDDTKENVNIDSTKNSSKEKEEFLNDLFPKKKFIPPQEPKISKRSHHEKVRKVRSSRPYRRKKPSQQEEGEKCKEERSDEIKIDHDDIEKVEIVSENDQKDSILSENKNDEIITSVAGNECTNSREDVATQSEVIIDNDEKENSPKQPSEPFKNSEIVETQTLRKSDDIKQNEVSQKKDEMKPKKPTAIKKPPSTEKASHHQQKSPHNHQTANHITKSKTTAAIPISNRKQKLTSKRSKTPPHKISPHPHPQPPTATNSQITAKISIKNQIESQKVHHSFPSPRLLEPRENSENFLKEKKQIEANTRLYMCNLPQSNNPLTVVTNLDDPSWHESPTFCNNNGYQKVELFDKEDLNEPIQINSSEKVENECENEEEDEDDRLAAAVGRRCPGLIFNGIPKSLNYAESVVPGAAWMRKTKVGSRLIKSTRPKVFAPIGKIEKSVRIRNSNVDRSKIIQTPLERIRCKKKI